MTQQGWSTVRQDNPPVSWNADAKKFSISMAGPDGGGVEAEWEPQITYVVRIREVGTDEWSYGFETPLTSCGFDGLKPDTEYEVEVRAKNDSGVSEPSVSKVRTKADGTASVA